MPEELDRDGDELSGVEIIRIRLPNPDRRVDESPEYTVRSCPSANSGLIVYAMTDRGWYANPSLRPVVRELLKMLGKM